MPTLTANLPEFEPKGRYTAERRDIIDNVHPEGFLLPDERKLMHHFMSEQNEGFAWDDSERGRFREDFFSRHDAGRRAQTVGAAQYADTSRNIR